MRECFNVDRDLMRFAGTLRRNSQMGMQIGTFMERQIP